MKIGVALGSNEPETAWNALRFAVQALDGGHAVRVFLLGCGVEAEGLRQGAYDVPAQMEAFAERGGELLACGTCLRSRQMAGSDLCPPSTIRRSDHLVGTRTDVLSRRGGGGSRAWSRPRPRSRPWGLDSPSVPNR